MSVASPQECAAFVAQAEAEEAHGQMLAGLDALLTKTFEKIHKIPSIDELYRAAGIQPTQQRAPDPLEPFSFKPWQVDDGASIRMNGESEFLEAVASYGVQSRRNVYALARAFAGDGENLKRWCGAPCSAWASIQAEIGIVGTRVVDGRITVEPNAHMRPTLARGRNSNPGEYQELRRVDTQTYRQVTEVSSLITTALVDPVVPQALPGLSEVVERADRMIQNALNERWRSDAASFTYIGFSVSEAIWETKRDGFVGIHAAKFREQSMVDRWHFDERGDTLAGCEFEGFTNDRYSRFVLPKGMTPESARLLLVNIGAVGNDVEGIPPTRPCIALDKLRQLIIQSYGISYQRFGVPLLKVGIELVEGLAQLLAPFGGAPSKQDLQTLVNQLDNGRARQPGTVRTPPGVAVDYMQPLRDMPDPLPMLRYIDEMKAVAWANEASTLGRSNYGSYAMADATDAKYMRSAPAFMQPFIRVYNELMQLHVLFNYPQAEDLEALPFYSFRFAGTQNSSKWLQDARDTIAAEPWTWPEPARRMAAQSLMLPPESFDSKPSAIAAVEDRASAIGSES